MPILLNRIRIICESHENIKYIDRTTPWGNPYIIGVDGDREDVCNKHKAWLNEWVYHKNEIKIKVGSREYLNKWVIEHIYMLKGKDLVCWCVPSKCHGEILSKLANME